MRDPRTLGRHSAPDQRHLRQRVVLGFCANRRPVTRDLVEDVCRDFDLEGGMEGSDAVTAALPVVVPAEIGRQAFIVSAPGESLLETRIAVGATVIDDRASAG